jgi:signal transduction histidine kinase
MFTAFYRVDTKENRSIEGTGLGLVIAKGIVEIHGGKIEMDSTEGVGTSFRFQIHDLNTIQVDGDDSGDSGEFSSSEIAA